MGSHVSGLGLCFVSVCTISTDAASGNYHPDVCTHQEASKRRKPTDPEERLHVYLNVKTHICHGASMKKGSNIHREAWAQALLAAQGDTEGPRQPYVLICIL